MMMMSWRHHKNSAKPRRKLFLVALSNLTEKSNQKKKRKKTRERMIFRDAIFRLLLFEIYITDGSSSRELEKV